ncbi:MAG: CPCC family cysteine-rich protein [Chitinophagaceae bacterium]|nr:CPCC family cysteine-rich protein [Chitinophagaceae bacterium]
MSYPEKFDNANLDNEQHLILAGFFQRHKLFDNYLAENKIKLYTFPGCGYPTLTERCGYEICSVCNWEDDIQDDEEADEIWGGPNYEPSLTENRLNIGKQIKKIAEQTSGRVNTNPAMALNILSRYDQKIEGLLETVPDDADIDHPVFKQYKKEGQELLRQLVAT